MTMTFCVGVCRGGGAGLGRGVRHRDGGYDHAADDGEVQVWGHGDEAKGGLALWHELRQGERAQAHKTDVAEGGNPQWGSGFRLRVHSGGGGCLRVQVLHMGKSATEFIGEVVIDLKELIPVLVRCLLRSPVIACGTELQ